MPKRIYAEGQFEYAASAQLASQLTLPPPLTEFVQSAFQAWTIDMCIAYRKRVAIKQILFHRCAVCGRSLKPVACFHDISWDHDVAGVMLEAANEVTRRILTID